ncbi:MAG: hypothetical protein WDN09_04310 [bacterium]
MVEGLTYKDKTTGETHELKVSGVFVEIGQIPNTDFAKEVVALDDYGPHQDRPCHAEDRDSGHLGPRAIALPCSITRTTSLPATPYALSKISISPYIPNNLHNEKNSGLSRSFFVSNSFFFISWKLRPGPRLWLPFYRTDWE